MRFIPENPFLNTSAAWPASDKALRAWVPALIGSGLAWCVALSFAFSMLLRCLGLVSWGETLFAAVAAALFCAIAIARGVCQQLTDLSSLNPSSAPELAELARHYPEVSSFFTGVANVRAFRAGDRTGAHELVRRLKRTASERENEAALRLLANPVTRK